MQGFGNACNFKSLVALREVIISGVGLSPECEQSLLHTCVDDPEKLVDLTKLARSHGHHFSRYMYIQPV